MNYLFLSPALVLKAVAVLLLSPASCYPQETATALNFFTIPDTGVFFAAALIANLIIKEIVKVSAET